MRGKGREITEKYKKTKQKQKQQQVTRTLKNKTSNKALKAVASTPAA